MSSRSRTLSGESWDPSLADLAFEDSQFTLPLRSLSVVSTARRSSPSSVTLSSGSDGTIDWKGSNLTVNSVLRSDKFRIRGNATVSHLRRH